jgi:hypothetical protein
VQKATAKCAVGTWETINGAGKQHTLFFFKKKERKERPSKLLLGFANPALLLFFGQEKER